MKLSINGHLCKACGYCIHFCPKQALELGKNINKKGYQYVELKEELCVMCGTCALVCPEAAIEFIQMEEE